MSGRHCPRCGTDYTAEEVASGQAFEPKGGADASPPRVDSICRPCRETEKDAHKAAHRWAVKATDTITSHVAKLRKPRAGPHCAAWYDSELTRSELIHTYGWNPIQIAHDLEFHYGNGCDYCHHPYLDMGHGAADITIDLYDPRRPPDYENVRFCCPTCQRRKGLLPPELWAIKKRIYRKWDRARQSAWEDRGMLNFGDCIEQQTGA